MTNRKFILISQIVFSICTASHAAGTSAGLSLLDLNGARPSSLGNAFTAVENDISGIGFNPASVGTLKNGHALFLYEKGVIDDVQGQFLLGRPTAKGGWGLGAGYYNGGDFEMEEGGATRNVTAQSDLTLALSGATRLGETSMGVTLKYISSTLVEQYSAKAYAFDAGISRPISSRMRIGVSVQNIGTSLKYAEEAESLPRMARVGGAFQLGTGKMATSLLLDAPYRLNEHKLEPAMGLEVAVGPMALRTGLQKLENSTNFTAGAGFLFDRYSMDYAFGLVQDLDTMHRVSVSMRFGGMDNSIPFAAKPKSVEKQTLANAPARKVEEKKAVAASADKTSTAQTTAAPRLSLGTLKRETPRANSRRVYIVKDGDTLASIAKKEYGNSQLWRKIYTANKHLIDDPREVEKGQKIVLP